MLPTETTVPTMWSLFARKNSREVVHGSDTFHGYDEFDSFRTAVGCGLYRTTDLEFKRSKLRIARHFAGCIRHEFHDGRWCHGPATSAGLLHPSDSIVLSTLAANEQKLY